MAKMLETPNLLFSPQLFLPKGVTVSECQEPQTDNQYNCLLYHGDVNNVKKNGLFERKKKRRGVQQEILLSEMNFCFS